MVKYLSYLFVFFLPFTQSLTIRVAGLPIKIYEIISIFILTILLFNRKGIKLFVPLSLFVFWGILVTVFSFLDLNDYAIYQWGGRETPLISMVSRIAYAAYHLISFGIIFFILERFDQKKIIHLFLVSGVSVAIYHLCNTTLSMMIGKVFLLPGSSEQYIGLPLGRAFRNGTFHEGNYVGLYYLICLAMTELSIIETGKKKWFRPVFIAGIVASFSTVNYFGLVLFYGIFFIFNRFHGRVLLAFLAVFVLIATVPYIGSMTYKKIVSGNKSATFSRDQRIFAVKASIGMFKERPFTGVGLGNYGYNYPRFSDQPVRGKFIANNVYASILAETGLVGFVLFFYFLFSIYKRKAEMNSRPIRVLFLSCFIAVLFVFNAFPSYEFAFLNFFFALMLKYEV